MKRYSIILLISLFTALHAAAQLYPVRTITNVGAPYPLSLEQYGSFDNSRLQLTIIPNDIALQNYPVKLRLVISGGWFKIYTNPSFIHKEILLNNGETMTFTGADLAEWFNPDNLIFEGYSKAQYMKTGRLPEGVYQIWFEAWDLYRDFNISGTTKAMVFTLENEPPILNFPENKKELEPYDPQNIVFNWSFRQSPFSASGSSHQYRFELWEIDPDDMNAEEAVRVMRPIYTTEVNATTLNYTAAEPLLFKGKRYAWRIQVFDPMGTMRYKNDGYSQVFWFRFGKDIPVPVLSLDKTTTSSITVKWENDYRVTKYELRYRNKAKEGANWYTKDATGQSATIDNLEQNTPYEIQLHGYNGSQEGDYSESVTAKTNQDKAFACGAAQGATNTENTDPLSMLKSGDIFRASDFDIEVYKTSGANGTFTGRGFAMIPYLKFVKFEVEFNGIQINKDYRMTRGQVRFIYNENNGLVVNISKIIDDLKSHEPRVVEDNPYKKAADQKIVSNADITEVTVDENGVVTAKTSDGRTTQVRGSASGDMVAVSGGSDDSEQYVADTKNKTVYKGTPEKATSGKKPEQPASKTSGPTQYEVTFLPHILEQGGMDIPTNNSPAANYHQIQVGGKTIQVPWKSVEKNKIDRIVAHIAGDPADTVRFLTNEGNLVLSAPGDKAFVSKSLQNTPSAGTFKQLLVTGREKEDLLKAWYPEYEQVNDTTKKQTRILAGQVNIAAYDKITLDVCIVEVNGATVPETLPIEKELNEIYASSVVQWKVSRIKDFKVNIEGMQNGIFDNTDPNNDMDYTDHEKQVKEALKDHRDYNRKTLYLFFIGGKTKDNMLKGYMPFNKQFGFIFRDNQQIQELIRTMAHELGHGAFRLRHPFSPKCPYPQTKGQTNNLMDYVDAGKALQALALHKYQWDEVHDFDLGLNWFEDEEEGEASGEESKLLALMNSIGADAFIFLKNCDINKQKNLENRTTITLNNLNYTAVVGKYNSLTGEIIISDGKTSENKLKQKYTSLELPKNKKEEYIIIGKENKPIYCDPTEDYSNFCSLADPDNSPEFLAKWAKDISKCITDKNNSYYDTSIPIKNIGDGSLSEIENEIQKLLDISYFKNINIGVEIKNSKGERKELSTSGSYEEAEIKLSYYIDYENNQVFIKEIIEDDFFKTANLSPNLVKVANEKNIPLGELQEDALTAMDLLKEEKINYGKGFAATLKEFFTSHVRVVQITGKIGKNIWEESVIPKGIWYSKAEGHEFYKGNFEVPAIPSGAIDGVIGEVFSMPIMIKTAGEIVLNKEKRQAFATIFTADGFTKMVTGIKDDFVESMHDEEKRPYVVTNTTVQVAGVFFTGGWIKGNLAKKGDDVLKEAHEALSKLPGGSKIADNVPASKLVDLAKKLQKLSEKPDFDKIANRIGDFSSNTRLKFVDDLISDADFYKKILDNPDFMDLFQVHKIEDIIPSEFERLRAIADDLDNVSLDKWANYGEEMKTLLNRFKKAKLIEDEALDVLSKNYDDFVRQVTIDVILPAGTKVPEGVKSILIEGGKKIRITTIVDGVGKNGDKIFFHEVKATSIVGKKAEDLLTTQQTFFKEVLKGERAGELIPRGDRAKQIFKEKIGKDLLKSSDIDKELTITVKELN